MCPGGGTCCDPGLAAKAAEKYHEAGKFTGMIPHEYVEELVRRSDIVEVVGSYVQLKRKGRLYSGLCPFHNEKTPSFYVYPETQSFYCFGCGVGGDVITFIKKIESLSYPEAVKMLAARAGMPEPEEDDGTGRMRSRILSMNKAAARFFHACLNSSVDEAAQARAYWRRRGLDDRTIARFGLGYAPDDGQALYHFLRDKGYTQAEMDASGLFKRSPAGRIYCLFWRRVITPIFDLRGNVIAFGGRVMDDSKPKYVNSPETLVYHKSETVFALQMAKKDPSRRYVLCEGYMDVISMQQAGIGTARLRLRHRPDPGAGQAAERVRRRGDPLLRLGRGGAEGDAAVPGAVPVQPGAGGGAQHPQRKDPDEYIKKYGAERFRELLDKAGNALDFQLGRARAKYDLAQDNQRLEYIQEAVRILADGTTPTEKELYAGRLAEETNLSKTAILSQVDAEAAKRGTAPVCPPERAAHSGEMDTIKLPYGQSGPARWGRLRPSGGWWRQPSASGGAEADRPRPAAGGHPQRGPAGGLPGHPGLLAEGREVNVGNLSGQISEAA